MPQSTLFIASDHGGFALKSACSAWLAQHNIIVNDLGTNSTERCDATDFAIKLVAELKVNPTAKGVLICRSGNAMAMTANRYQHIRAALCTHVGMAQKSREHNDANVLVLGADIVAEDLALSCLEAFIKTDFLGGRYAERRDKLTSLGGL